MKKIYYWSPYLTRVGTYKATINSLIGFAKYSKNYEVHIINSCGEWNEAKNYLLNNNIKLINLKYNYFRYLPKTGFLKSRLSFVLIFLTSIIPLIKLIINHKPDYLVTHLVSSLPLILIRILDTKTKLILRISGYPKLNFLRKLIWKFTSKKIHLVTCPSIELIKQLKEKRIFDENKLNFLPDPILNIKNILSKIKDGDTKDIDEANEYFISVGRLTKQKNFDYLIKEFQKFQKIHTSYKLLIFGDGEYEKKLNKLIINLDLENKVFLKGYSNNIYKYMKNAKAFILSSLWEDPGFVIVEAAMCNLFIISSDCKNGPSEILEYGKGGILYKSNQDNALFDALIKYINNEKKEIKKINVKKNIKKYSIFRHYLYFNKILKTA